MELLLELELDWADGGDGGGMEGEGHFFHGERNPRHSLANEEQRTRHVRTIEAKCGNGRRGDESRLRQ